MLLDEERMDLEWKSNTNSNFLKTVSAFANYFDGDIVFGVEDDGHVIGISDINQEKLAIENAINDNIKPCPKYILRVETVENKKIIVLKVLKSPKPPYFYKKTVYQRQNTATIPVDEVAFQQLYLEGSNLSFDELETNDTGLTFELLEQNLREKVGVESFSADLLRTMGLLKGENHTNAGMLFADENEYKYGIDMVRFGSNDNIFVERQEVKGVSLLKQYEMAMAMFDKWYSPYEEVVGFYRESRIQIPREAFREAIANALIHRDYVLKANIRIAMREDSIEIISPGGLPTGISKESYVQGLYSQIRNETLAEVFRRLQIIEKYGTGIRRIRETYHQFKESPVFDVLGGLAIQVVLPKISYMNSINTGTDYESQVLQFINEKIEISSAEIKMALGGSDATLKRVLLKLASDGKIKKIGKTRGVRYQSIL